MTTVSVNKSQSARHTAAARLDRLPIGSFQKRVMWLTAYVFFFELGDLNNFAFAAPELQKQWKLSIDTIGLITSAAFIGMFVGAIGGGWFADKVGRKKGLLLSTAFFSIFSMLNACAWDVPGLFVTRFFTGVGLSGMTIAAITYISEMFPAMKRGTYQAWVMTIGLVGIPISAFVAGELIPKTTWGWRMVFVWGGLGIFIFLFSRMLEESPRWYEDQGRLAEADKALDRIEANSKAEFGSLPPVTEASKPPGPRGKFGDVFERAYLGRTSMLVGVYVFQTMGIFGFLAWVPTLLADHGFNLSNSLFSVTMMDVGAPIGGLLAVLISDRWERKYMITIASLIIAFFGVMYGLSSKMALIVIFGFCVMMFIQAFAPLLYAYTPECFPTAIRSSGSGVAYGAGRLANSFGPMIVAVLFTHYGYKSVFVYIVATWLLVAFIVAAFGPKTKGQALT